MALISILSAKYIAPLSIEIYFSDNTKRLVNIGGYIKIHPHIQYNTYLNENKFNEFKIEMGNIVWGKNCDTIFPVKDLYNGLIGQKRQTFA